MKKTLLSLFLVCIFGPYSLEAEAAGKYENTNSYGTIHLVKQQAESSIKNIRNKLDVLQRKLNTALRKDAKNKKLKDAKNDLKIFETYLWNESIPWFENMIAKLYLSGEHKNPKAQWKKKDVILKYEEDCMKHLNAIEKDIYKMSQNYKAPKKRQPLLTR